MNNLILDHEFTPPELKKLNHLLLELFSIDPLSEVELLKLVNIRDEVIQQHIQNCDSDSLKLFCHAEIKVNGALVACVKELSNVSLKELSALIRGRKAVKKYI